MAVVTTTFSIPANTVWANTTWSATDPSGKVNTQLVNWVTAINDPSKIEIVQNPGSATSRATTSFVTWLLRMREGDTSSDYGILYKGRYAGTGSTTSSGYIGSYSNRVVSTSANNYGTFNSVSPSLSNEGFTVDGTVLTAYEASGNTPWFLYAWENNTRANRRMDLLLRCDTTNIVPGSYYPSTGLGKWIYVISTGNGTDCYTPQNSYLAPFKGVNAVTTMGIRHPVPNGTYGNNYFFRFSGQFGNTHYLGDVTNDILISNANTGQFGDTMTLSSVTYTCIGNMGPSSNYWVKTSA